MSSRQGVLLRRPDGRPCAGDIGFVELRVPEPGPGQLVVRKTWMSLDPAMRIQLSGGPDDYLPPFAIGDPPRAGRSGPSRPRARRSSPRATRSCTARAGETTHCSTKRGPVRRPCAPSGSRRPPTSPPDGIDLYFDNVGGDHLVAALDTLRPGGRVALCGAISTYDATGAVPGPPNLFNAVARGLTLRGFMARMYPHRLGAFRERMREWLVDGSVVYPETVHHGLDAAPAAFADLLGGGNVGKVLVEL